MDKLPIGIQSFEVMRTRGFVYVDKTETIHRLVKPESLLDSALLREKR